MRASDELVTALTKLRHSNPTAWSAFKTCIEGFREKNVVSIIGASDFGSMKLVQGELAATDTLLKAINKAERPMTKEQD